MIYNHNKIEMLRQRYPEGTRICVDSMDDYCPIESGTCGTVYLPASFSSKKLRSGYGTTLIIIGTDIVIALVSRFICCLYTNVIQPVRHIIHIKIELNYLRIFGKILSIHSFPQLCSLRSKFYKNASQSEIILAGNTHSSSVTNFCAALWNYAWCA